MAGLYHDDPLKAALLNLKYAEKDRDELKRKLGQIKETLDHGSCYCKISTVTCTPCELKKLLKSET
jgi:CRISPR/Cas system-associated exonuclease Cas4 (RecB family)